MKNLQPGLRQNWKQFSLLALVNAFAGGMVGIERSIFPQFAEQEFGVSSATAILSFITAFGINKAIANYYPGKLGKARNRTHSICTRLLYRSEKTVGPDKQPHNQLMRGTHDYF